MESAKESLYGLDYVSGLQLLIYSHRWTITAVAYIGVTVSARYVHTVHK